MIPDDGVDPSKVRRILVCSGKVFYDLAAERRMRKRDDVAIVRLEQLYPMSDALSDALRVYDKSTPVVWVQEEPRNMGAWYFLSANKERVFGPRLVSLASRPESASPATGSKAAHDLEQKMLLDDAFDV